MIFERDGFFLTPPILPADLVARTASAMDGVLQGDYETGVPPHKRNWNPGDDDFRIRKIDQPHRSNRTIWECITHRDLGRWAADITGAETVQVWAVQLLHKPPGGEQSGNVGWHQDINYWKPWWEGEVFTAWIAISDVTREAGPMIFVRGSHRWGEIPGNFWETNRDAQREAIPIPLGAVWEEVPAVLPPGAVSFHHRFTIHGSGPNRSSLPRRSLAVHMRTEKSKPLQGATLYAEYAASYMPFLNDPMICPVIWR